MPDSKNIKDYNNLSEPEKKKLQKEFHKDDLSYLASFAVENNAISSKDIEELNNRIDNKVKSSFSRSGFNSFLTLLCGVFIGCTLFFAWYQIDKTKDPRYENVLEEKTMHQPPIILPGAAQTTEPEKTLSEYPKEHFSIRNSAEQIESVIVPEKIETAKVPDIEINTSEADIQLRYLPNAPVIFIKDLKVAAYNVYYFKNNQNIDINTGTSAEFANKNEKASLKTGEPDNNYYAHQVIKDAMVYFSSKDYGNCAELLSLLYKYNKKDVNAQFYLGMGYYYLGNYKNAAGFFTEVMDNDINVFYQEAEFYKALCLLKTGEEESAKTLLKSIAGKKLFYAERAEEMLKKL